MTDSLVIIPSFNEIENIEAIIEAVFDIKKDFHVLVVDDNSPDGTAKVVEALQLKHPGRLFLEVRKEKAGLGTAYIHGFKWALAQPNNYQYIFEMDADFSHDPKDLARFETAIQDKDLVIGSRYVSGVNVINWPMSRLLLSWFANIYTRVITGMPIADATGFIKPLTIWVGVPK